MIVMIGENSNGNMWVPQMRANGWGRMYVAKPPTPFPGEPWGFDNGAFGAWKRALPWDADKYQRLLDRAYQVGTPYLAVVPDIPAQGLRSLEFSLSWRDRLPNEWPLYLAVQDGMTLADVEPHLGRFDGLFLGGSDAFKRTARGWSDLAHRNGLRFHYARASSGRAYRRAFWAGADSCDSANILRSRDNWRCFSQAVAGTMLQREMNL